MDPRIETSLASALQTKDIRDFLERAAPAIGLPGPKPKLLVARELGLAIVRDPIRGRAFAEALAYSEREDGRVLAAAAFSALATTSAPINAAPGTKARRGAKGVDAHLRDEMMAALSELGEDNRGTVRMAVLDGLCLLFASDLTFTLEALKSWTDGYLQAHVALSALSDRTVLTTLPNADVVLALLDPAFDLADNAPRAADRWQGVRVLRQALPAQITAFVGRFSEIWTWVLGRATATRPETREVLLQTADALDRASFRRTDVELLRAALKTSAKPPRDPSRIVHGTRKRSGK